MLDVEVDIDVKEIEQYVINTIAREYIAQLQKKADRAYEEMLDKVIADFLDVVKERIKTIYNTAIENFYANYPNPKYDRREDKGLKHLLVITHDKKKGELSWDFDPSKIPYRDGSGGGEGDLYDLVFRQGYHGGSTYDSKKGKHPNPGVPYYRYPAPYYTYWGRPAEKAPISPLEDFNQQIENYKKKQFQEDYDSIYEKHLETFKNTWMEG